MDTELIICNIDNCIKLEINVYELSDEYLNIWLNALNTEYNIRENNINYLETKKTIIYMNCIYISLGLININLLKKWKYIIQNEYNKRLHIKHERLFDPNYIYINKNTQKFKSIGTQTDNNIIIDNINRLHNIDEIDNNDINDIYNISESTLEYLDKIEKYVKTIEN